jgi:hypothetical protein
MNRQQKRGGETWHGDDLGEPHGKRFVPISPSPRLPPVVDAHVRMIGVAWRASSGSSGPAPHGGRSPGGRAAPRPAGAGSRTGKRRACCSRSGAPSWPRSTTSRNGAGTNASPMAASSRRKKGAPGRQDQAGQGHDGDGSGRWRGYSVGSSPWARRPRRRSPSSRSPSPRSRAGGRATPGDPGNGPSG